MALTFLIDTSVVKRLEKRAVRERVEPMARAGIMARSSMCDLEVGFSARNADEWDSLMLALDAFERVEMTPSHLARALQVQRMLAERSQRGRKLPDLMMAATAEDLGLTVMHYDGDFDAIAAVTGQRCEWVVPAGSVS